MSVQTISLILALMALTLSVVRWLPGVSLRRPVSLLVAFSGLSLAGLLAFFTLPIELLPNASFGVISITIPVRGGLSPVEIERQITRPVEDAVSLVEHLKRVISNSKKDRAVVSLEFEPGTDMEFAALNVREKFAKVKGQLPKEIEQPVIAHYRESDVPIFIFALMSKTRSPEELRVLLEGQLHDRLLRLNGMANVEIVGSRERKIVVDVDRHRLASFGTDIRELVERIGQTNLDLKAGEVGSEASETAIRTRGQYRSLDEMANTVVGMTREGTLIRLKDVARVQDSFLERESLARLNMKSAVTVYLQKETGANTVHVADLVKKELGSFVASLPKDVEYLEISNQADSILEALRAVRGALFIGIVLVVMVLGFFLGLRPAGVVIISIPVVISITGLVMKAMGLSLNVMTLSGLALATGLLVDNSIVILEAVLRQAQKAKFKGGASGALVEEVAGKMTPAIICGTLTIMVVYLPIIVFSRQIQILFSGVALTITASLLISMVVALSIVVFLSQRLLDGQGHLEDRLIKTENRLRHTDKGRCPDRRHAFNVIFTTWIPAFAGMTSLLRRKIGLKPKTAGRPHGNAIAEPMLERLRMQYEIWLRRVISRRYAVVGSVIALFLLSLYVLQFHLDKNLSTGEEQDEFIVFVELPSGTRLDISDRIVREIESRIRDNVVTASSIKSVTARVEGWSSKIYVTLTAAGERRFTTAAVIENLRPLVQDLGKKEDAFVYFSAPESGQELVVNVYGVEEKLTLDTALQVASLIGESPGFKDTRIRYRPGRPEVLVRVNPERTSLYGLDPTDVGWMLHALTRGLRATTFRDKDEEVETVVRLSAEERESVDDLKTLLITTPRGLQIPLAQVADFEYDLAPSEIWRQNKERMIQVSSNLKGMSLEKAAGEIKKSLAQIAFSPNIWAEIGGDYEDRVQSERDFKTAFFLAFILVYTVMAILFESLTRPLFLILSVPFAVIGIVMALFFTGTPLTMGSIMGFLMAGGMVVNHAILLMDSFFRLESDIKFDKVEALVLVGQERLRPILMTTLTTVFGLLPMALDHGGGAQLWRPLGVATIGGLLSSLCLTLFVLPAIVIIADDVHKNGIRVGMKKALSYLRPPKTQRTSQPVEVNA